MVGDQGGPEGTDPQVGMLGVARSYLENLHRAQRMVSEIRSSALTRLVWFVAVSGYVLFNAKDFWDGIRSTPTEGRTLLLLSLPWVLTAFCAILTHWLMDEAAIKDGAIYSGKIAELEMFMLKVQQGQGQWQELKDILDETRPSIKEASARLKCMSTMIKRLERLTLLLLFVSFAASVTISFLLN